MTLGRITKSMHGETLTEYMRGGGDSLQALEVADVANSSGIRLKG